MSGEEASAIYAELVRYLQGVGLSWLPEHVDLELRSGVLEVKRVEDLPADQLEMAFLDMPAKKRRQLSKAEFLVARRLQPHERLIALIEAIDQIVVKGSELEVATGEQLKKHRLERGFVFVGEESGSPAVEYEEGASRERLREARHLSELLQQLRRECSE